jgi:hypothetical protein
MRQASKHIPDSAEKTVRDIRRATRRSALCWKVFAAKTALLSFVARKGSTNQSRRGPVPRGRQCDDGRGWCNAWSKTAYTPTAAG